MGVVKTLTSLTFNFIYFIYDIFRVISEFLPEEQVSIIQYDCLPSYSNMQFAEIATMDGAVIVPRFGMRSEKDFKYDTM